MSTHAVSEAPNIVGRHDDRQPQGIYFVSPWGPLPEPVGDASEYAVEREKHERFRWLAMQALESRFPWLARLLEAEGAYVLAGLAKFYIAMPARPRDWIEIPELSECLCLAPWAEADETAH